MERSGVAMMEQEVSGEKYEMEKEDGEAMG